jgi:hypothetical protein
MGGVTIRSVPGNSVPQLVVRGGTSHLIFIDGMQFMGDQDEAAAIINSTEIDRIDVYKSLAKIAMISAFGTGVGGNSVGSNSAGGVIAIYTKSPYKNQIRLDTNIVAEGFATAEDSKPVDYSGKNRNRNVVDNRICLHYDPFINTINSEQKLEFYTGDTVGEINIQIEGVRSDGMFVNKKLIIMNQE